MTDKPSKDVGQGPGGQGQGSQGSRSQGQERVRARELNAAVRKARGKGTVPEWASAAEVAVKGQGDAEEGEHSNEEITQMPTPEALKASGATVGDPTKIWMGWTSSRRGRTKKGPPPEALSGLVPVTPAEPGVRSCPVRTGSGPQPAAVLQSTRRRLHGRGRAGR